MLKHITADKAMLIASLADQVNRRPRTMCENARRVEDDFADLLDSMDSAEFAVFQSEIRKLIQPELNDLVAIVWLAKGEFNNYEDALSHAERVIPSHDYVCHNVINISGFIKQGVLLANA